MFEFQSLRQHFPMTFGRPFLQSCRSHSWRFLRSLGIFLFFTVLPLSVWLRTEPSSSKLTFMMNLDVYWWLTKVKSERVYKLMEIDEFYLRRYCKFNRLRQAFRTVYCTYCLWRALSISLIAQNLCYRLVDLRCHVTDGKT